MNSSDLRNWLASRNEQLGVRAAHLWDVARPLHDRQNRPDSNENGRVHIEMVERNLWRLLNECRDSNGTRHLEHIVPEELFIMCSAVCCHDFDKALKSAAPLPAGFRHGDGSGQFVVFNHDVLGLTLDQADAIHAVVRLHDLKSPEFERELRLVSKRELTPFGPIDLRRAALLLKTADILQCDRSRIPSIGIDASKLTPNELRKMTARRCTKGWIADGSRVLIQAAVHTGDERDAVKGGFDYMTVNEWAGVREDLEAYGFPHALALELIDKSPPSVSIATTPSSPWVVVIDRDFKGYSLDELSALLEEVDLILGTKGDAVLKHIREGSVEVVLNLTQAQVALLETAIGGGKLRSYGVLAAPVQDTDERRRNAVAKSLKRTSGAESKAKILFLTSGTGDVADFSVRQEREAIEKLVAESPEHSSIEFSYRAAQSISDVSEALREEKPTILHFSGHGVPGVESGLVLYNAAGIPNVVQGDSLGRLLQSSGHAPRMVVLNSCYSGTQAAAMLKSGSEYVVGISGSIAEKAAQSFSAELYRGLVSGLTIQGAFGLATEVARAKGELGTSQPVLLASGDARPSEGFLPNRVQAADVAPIGTKAELLTEKANASILQVFDAERPLGSGFLVSSDGIMITAAHVINDTSGPLFVESQGHRRRLEILAINTKRDVGILRFSGNTSKPLSLVRKPPAAVGADLTTVGFILGEGFRIENGVLAGRVLGADATTVELLIEGVSARPGFSGGPVLNADGIVVGMVTGRDRDRGLTYAISSETILVEFSQYLPVAAAAS